MAIFVGLINAKLVVEVLIRDDLVLILFVDNLE